MPETRIHRNESIKKKKKNPSCFFCDTVETSRVVY